MRLLVIALFVTLTGCQGAARESGTDWHAPQPLSADEIDAVYEKVHQCVGYTPATAKPDVTFTRDKPGGTPALIRYGDPNRIEVWADGTRYQLYGRLSHEFVHHFLHAAGYEADSTIQRHPGGFVAPIFERCRVEP